MVDNDYISRQDVITTIRENGVYGSGYSNEEREDNVVDMIESVPAADVRPVIKCKWKNLTRAGFASVEATCSACGKTLFYKSWWHFCPNCGAKVEKEQEDK